MLYLASIDFLAACSRRNDSSSDMRQISEWTLPQTFSTRLAAAASVPPVARRSSMIATFCPGLTAPDCISIELSQYSSE